MAMEWEGKRLGEATSQPQDQLSDAPVAPTSTPPPHLLPCGSALPFFFSPFSAPFLLQHNTLPSLSTRVKRAGSINPVEPQFPHL